MKVINYIYIGFLLLILAGCESDQINGDATYSGQPFVRFFLLTDSNNSPIENGDVVQNDQLPLEEYEHESVLPLKIPVALTYIGLDKEVSLSYTVDVTDGFTDYSISPEELTFDQDNLTDTLVLSFTKRWDVDDSVTFDFTLDRISDDDIHIGQLNDTLINSELEVVLSDINTTMSFSSNRIEIDGNQDEQVEFTLDFSNGFIPDEITDLDLFEITNGFDYSLEQVIMDDEYESIKYIMTLTDDIQNDDVSYTTTIALKDNDLYTGKGTTSIQIVKPIQTARDKAVFAASNFYDLSNTYYRTYGYNWLYSSTNEECGWQSFNAFTYPVVVDKDDENAVLYSDNGTEDESDDIYHDAFKIGFNASLSGKTTNSFNLKRWFSNESTSADLSPGFNIEEALEFYPEDGNSETNGTVLVIPQIITISNKEGTSYQISISGDGTYEELEDGVFEIDLTFEAYNEELFGGTQVSYYKIYNENYSAELNDLDTGCIEEIEL